MKAMVNVNGRITGDQDATISVFDHGFLYGEGIYETMRTYNGRTFLFDRHMRRLRASAARLHLNVPLSDEAMLSRVAETLDAGKFGPDVYIRLLVTRGVGDLTYDLTATPAPSVVVIVKPHVVPAQAVERGIKIVRSSFIRNHPDSVNPIIKSNNLLNNALAMQEALQKGATEALMLNYRGELAECAQSNFFIVRGGVALTPSLQAGLLEGITRNFLFEIGPAIGIQVRDAVLLERDLDTADEAFITSTTREIVPVVRIDERIIGAGVPGPVTRTLLGAFRKKADEMTRAPVRA